MIENVILGTQIGSILTFVGIHFRMYRLLVSTKDAVIGNKESEISLLKQRLEGAKEAIEELRSNTPDALLVHLERRLKIQADELDRVNADASSSSELIAKSEHDLSELRNQVKVLNDLICETDLKCEECGSLLTERRQFSQSYQYGDRDYDVDYEYRKYACGATFIDDTEESPCMSSTLP